MSGVRTERIASFDGTELAIRRLGEGQAVVLLHGLFSSAEMNWIRFGHAARVAEAGFEAIMPDLRAHGDSGKPHDPAAYPAGVLVNDLKAFVAVSFMKTMKIDRTAARLLLGAVDDTSEVDLAAITMPTLVVCGEKDQDNGSPQKLVSALPNARFEEIPGTHMSSVTEPALGEAIARFLSA